MYSSFSTFFFVDIQDCDDLRQLIHADQHRCPWSLHQPLANPLFIFHPSRNPSPTKLNKLISNFANRLQADCGEPLNRLNRLSSPHTHTPNSFIMPPEGESSRGTQSPVPSKSRSESSRKGEEQSRPESPETSRHPRLGKESSTVYGMLTLNTGHTFPEPPLRADPRPELK